MEENLKKTCLHSAHKALNAQMSAFAGFDMPILYEDIAKEHNAVRRNAGVFDVSHMGEIFVEGRDAEKFVNHIFTNDVRELCPGGIQYGMMLYENGGTVDDLLVYKMEDGKYLLVVNASNIDKDHDYIKKHSEGFDVVIDNQSDKWGQLAIQGPDSVRIMKEVLGFEKSLELKFYTFCTENGVLVSRTGYTGEDGFEVYSSPENIVSMWNKLIEAGVCPCGLGCRDTLRFEAGLPLYGDELTEEISPLMAGLGMFCKLGKDDFIGREALVSQKEKGVSEKIAGLEVLDKAIPRAGYQVEDENGVPVGKITTGYRSITLDKSLAFGLLKTEYSSLGTRLFVRIRKKVFPAVVIKKRFYQPNYNK